MINFKKNEYITVYWSALNAYPIFKDNSEKNLISQNLSYNFSFDSNFIKNHTEIKKSINYLREIKSDFEGTFFACPATKGLFNNIYYISNDNDIYFDIDNEKKEKLLLKKEVLNYTPNKEPFSELIPIRSSNLKNYFCGRLSPFYWFFADQSLEMRVTAPFFPSVSPAKDSVFSSGEFNIGKWFRPITLEWHFPLETKDIVFEKDKPIVFIEFKTDKKIIFKKFTMDKKMMFLTNQCVSSPSKDGEYKTLDERYSISDEAELPSIVLNEIKNKLI